MTTRKALIGTLLAEHGRTFSTELGIPIERGTRADDYERIKQPA